MKPFSEWADWLQATCCWIIVVGSVFVVFIGEQTRNGYIAGGIAVVLGLHLAWGPTCRLLGRRNR